MIDLRPIRPPSIMIMASGEIEGGDTQKLRALMDSVDTVEVRDVMIIFDSPGGSLFESLEMADYISSIPAIVSTQVGTESASRAICASACVYAYLAGDYRYLARDARIGVHQFGVYSDELDGRQGAALGQVISGLLSEHIRKSRARPELFEAISGVGHDDIMWIPRDRLEDWRVVTNGVYDEQEKYINISGSIGLELTQIAVTGDSWLRLICPSGEVIGVAGLNEPDLAAFGTFEIVVNDISFPIEAWDVLARDNGRTSIAFTMPPDVIRAAIYARSFGARVVAPSEHVFFGFQQTMWDGLLTEFLQGCRTETNARLSQMRDLPGTDFTGNDLTREGFRNISFAQCKEICIGYEQCVAVSYVQASAWCWPKGQTNNPRSVDGVISAIKY